jgi:hypothetical protein
MFTLNLVFVFFNCTKETLKSPQENNKTGAVPAIAWQTSDGTICEPGSCNRPAIAKDLKRDVIEMVRLENVDNNAGPRKAFMRNYYFSQGAWYHQSVTFGDGQDFGAPAICTNRSQGNLEVVVRRDNRLRHYWRDETTGVWNGGMVFGDNVKSDPALICNMQNSNLEVVVREGPRLRHYWRDDVSGNWFNDPEVFANDLAGSPAMAQASDGNLHVVIRSKERQVHHFERVWSDGRFLWQYRGLFGYSIKDDPAMTVNYDNNRLQVVVKEGVGTTGLKHYEYSGTWNQVSAIVSKMELHYPVITTLKNHNYCVICLDDPKDPCMIGHFNYIQE